jgi:hypothetical protein
VSRYSLQEERRLPDSVYRDFSLLTGSGAQFF